MVRGVASQRESLSNAYLCAVGLRAKIELDPSSAVVAEHLEYTSRRRELLACWGVRL